MTNPFLGLMTAADKHAKAHNAQTPVPSSCGRWLRSGDRRQNDV
ncbi:hypothetical protein [Tunturiibacter psychrotolerans]